MTIRQRILLSLGAVAICYVALSVAMTCEQNGGTRHEIQAAEEKGRADEHAQAAASVQDTSAKAEVERLKGELAALKAKVRPRPAVPPVAPVAEPAVVVGDEHGLDPGVQDLRAVVAKQEEVIAAQDLRIRGLETKAYHWEQAFKHERDRATGLELALEAQKHVAKAALWRGRIGGVAVGFGVGLLAGRLK